MTNREDLPPEEGKRPTATDEGSSPGSSRTSETGSKKGADGDRNYADSLKLAYGDLSGEPRYGDQRYRPEPYQGAPDSEGGYYEALSASTVRPPTSGADGSVGSLGVDEQLVERVSAALEADPDVDSVCVNVNCVDGIVTLTGRVPDRSVKRRADDVAYGVAGVRDVTNLLTFL